MNGTTQSGGDADFTGFALFETAVGRCAIVWRGARIVGTHLPEASDARALAALARRFPSGRAATPPTFVAAAMARIATFLDGGADGFGDLPLDLESVSAWERRVYAAAQAIPAGTTTTYGAMAASLGDAGQARAVGQALGRNPWPIVVPCHRITAADGRTGGFSAPGGASTKLRLLEIEGALAPDTLPLFGGPH